MGLLEVWLADLPAAFKSLLRINKELALGIHFLIHPIPRDTIPIFPVYQKGRAKETSSRPSIYLLGITFLFPVVDLTLFPANRGQRKAFWPH